MTSCAGFLGAAEYHVAPTGKDTNAGSVAAPFREIRKALTVLAPGDTVYVADGSYKGFDAVGLGAAGTVTRIVATGTGAIITKTTDRGINNPNNIVVWQCSHLVFDGLRTFGSDNAGMRIVQCSHVTVRNGVFGNHLRWGIVTSHSDDLVLEYNECYGSIEQHGIYVSNSGDRPIVRGNRIHSNIGSGLRSNGDIAQGGDGIITGALFEDNIIYNNGALGGAAMNLDGLQDGIIRNNLMYDNHGSGIALFKGGGAQGPKGMKVLHNTIVMASDGRYNLRITDVIGTITVRNNILYNANTAKGPYSWNTPQDAAFTDSDYNVFGGGRYVSTNGEVSRISMDTWIASGREPHSVPTATLPALFADSAAANFRLTATSPAISRGIALTEVARDIQGILRPQGAAPDLGAYEFTSGYEAWKLGHGFPADTLASHDSDGDEIPLLMEYALDLHPHVFSRGGLPVGVIEDGHLRLTYRKSHLGLHYYVEVSHDLRTWSTDGVDQGGSGPIVTASIPLPSGANARQLRLRVTLP